MTLFSHCCPLCKVVDETPASLSFAILLKNLGSRSSLLWLICRPTKQDYEPSFMHPHWHPLLTLKELRGCILFGNFYRFAWKEQEQSPP